MPLPTRSFHSLNDVAARWSAMPIDVVGWATEDLLALSAALPPTKTAASRVLAGIVEIAGSDVIPLFRLDARLESISIRRIRAQRETKWQWIVEPPEGVIITAPEVLVTRAEIERFEQRHDLFSAPTPREIGQQDRPPEAGRAASSGAPPRYDWNAFTGAVALGVHDEGKPTSQSELIRDMLDRWPPRAICH